jgi:hypothetical protein
MAVEKEVQVSLDNLQKQVDILNQRVDQVSEQIDEQQNNKGLPLGGFILASESRTVNAGRDTFVDFTIDGANKEYVVGFSFNFTFPESGGVKIKEVKPSQHVSAGNFPFLNPVLTHLGSGVYNLTCEAEGEVDERTKNVPGLAVNVTTKPRRVVSVHFEVEETAEPQTNFPIDITPLSTVTYQMNSRDGSGNGKVTVNPISIVDGNIAIGGYLQEGVVKFELSDAVASVGDIFSVDLSISGETGFSLASCTLPFKYDVTQVEFVSFSPVENSGITFQSRVVPENVRQITSVDSNMILFAYTAGDPLELTNTPKKVGELNFVLSESASGEVQIDLDEEPGHPGFLTCLVKDNDSGENKKADVLLSDSSVTVV